MLPYRTSTICNLINLRVLHLIKHLYNLFKLHEKNHVIFNDTHTNNHAVFGCLRNVFGCLTKLNVSLLNRCQSRRTFFLQDTASDFSNSLSLTLSLFGIDQYTKYKGRGRQARNPRLSCKLSHKILGLRLHFKNRC